MATANVVSTLSGLFKEVYADALMSLVPKAARLQKDAPFVTRDKREGNIYHQPVRLTRAHGWTLNTGGDAFPLNPPEPARTQDAQIQGSSFVLREVISYTAAAKLLSGSGSGEKKRAFVSGTSYMVENMTETAAFILELQLLYGQSAIGTLSAYVSGTGTTSQVFTFTKGTFIPAMWSGLENGYVEIYNGATKLADAQVTVVDVENRNVTFLGVAADLDAVHTAIASALTVYLRDTKSAGMVGLRSIVANTGSLFNVDAAVYSLWAGNTYSAASGSLTFAAILRALNKPVNRGLMSDACFYISPKSWTDCNNDLAALRRYADKAGGKIEQGAESIMYYGQSGSVELVPHIFVKPSEAMGIPKGKMNRLGASELTFSPPGMEDGSFFENLPDHAGYGTRCFWNQALFVPCPNQCVLISNIVNSDD